MTTNITTNTPHPDIPPPAGLDLIGDWEFGRRDLLGYRNVTATLCACTCARSRTRAGSSPDARLISPTARLTLRPSIAIRPAS
jgi:hypothetical protein